LNYEKQRSNFARFGRMVKRSFDHVEKRFNGIEKRFTTLERGQEDIYIRFDNVLIDLK